MSLIDVESSPESESEDVSDLSESPESLALWPSVALLEASEPLDRGSESLFLALKALTLSSLAGPAFSGTLDIIKKRGHLKCGVSTGLPGFSFPDGKGNWSGMDVDFCHGVAAVIFPKGYMTDPRDDLNPETTIRVRESPNG